MFLLELFDVCFWHHARLRINEADLCNTAILFDSALPRSWRNLQITVEYFCQEGLCDAKWVKFTMMNDVVDGDINMLIECIKNATREVRRENVPRMLDTVDVSCGLQVFAKSCVHILRRQRARERDHSHQSRDHDS